MKIWRISDDRLCDLSGPDYLNSEPGQIAAELLLAREQLRARDNAARARAAKILARKFAEEIRQVLSEGELTEVRRLNVTAAYEGCCATHDFCDANYSMLLAYSIVSCTPEDDVDLDTAADLFNRAWDLAKAAEFYEERLK